MTRMTLADAGKGNTDWDRLRREQAADVEPAADDADDAFDWVNAVVVSKPRKLSMTIRLDDDILGYFRATGPGYQGRINAVLRAYVEAQDRRKTGAVRP